MHKLFKALAVFVIATFMLAACGGSDTPTAAPTTVAPTTAPAGSATNTTAPAAVAPTNTAAAMAPTTAPAMTASTGTGAAATPAMSGTTTMSGTTGMTMPKVTGNLTVWESYGSSHGSAESTAWTAALAQFQKDNPDAKITALDVPFDQIFNKFETEAAAGGGPDLYIAPNDSLGKEVRAGLLMDLTSKLAGHQANDLDVAVNGSMVDGKQYEVPESLKAVAMFYNSDKVKTVPATTDDLMTAVKGGLKIGFNESAYHNWAFYSGFGGTIFDASGTCVAGAEVAAAFQYLVDLKKAGAQFYTDGSKLSQDFTTGKLDATIDGPWLTGDYKKALADKLGVAPIPAGPKGPSMPLTAPDGWYVNANTKNADQAVNFALYMTSPTIEQTWVTTAGHIPADKTIQISDPVVQGFAKQMTTGFPRPQSKEMDNYWSSFGDALTKIMEKSADPTQTVAAACAAVNKANNKTGGASTGTGAAATPAMSGTTTMSGTTGMTMPMPKVTGNLTVWESYGSSHGSAESTAWTAALAQFQKDNPDAKVTTLDVPFDQIFNKFETEAAAGGGPDLYIAPNDSLGKEVRAGLLMDLSSKLAGHLGNDLPVAVSGGMVDGKQYEVPESLKAVAMFANTATTPPGPAPTTTDQLLAAVKAGVKVGLNESAYHNWAFYSGFGGTIFDASGKCVAGPEVAASYQYLVDLKKAGVKFYTDGSKLSQDFTTGKLDATIDGPWLTGDYKKALGDKLVVFPIPAGPKGPSMPLTAPDGWYVNANTKNVDQAVNFALYMTSPTIEQIWVTTAGHIPADKTVQISDPIVQGFAAQMQTGFPRPQSKEMDNYWSSFGDALTKIMEKSADPTQTVAAACAAVNKANNK